MGTEPLDLKIDGTLLRVVCDNPRGARVLRSALSHHVAKEPAPPGFYLEAPTDDQRLYVLLDRSGLVLARTRRLEDCLAALAGHLAAFRRPPEGTTRFRMRTLVDRDQRVTLALPPLLQLPPLVERRIDSLGQRIVDRLVVDIDGDRRVHVPDGRWPELSGVGDGIGHVSTFDVPAPVDLLLAPGARRARAQIIAAVASAGSPGASHRAILDVSEAVSDVEIEFLDPSRPTEIYRMLRQRSS